MEKTMARGPVAFPRGPGWSYEWHSADGAAAESLSEDVGWDTDEACEGDGEDDGEGEPVEPYDQEEEASVASGAVEGRGEDTSSLAVATEADIQRLLVPASDSYVTSEELRALLWQQGLKPCRRASAMGMAPSVTRGVPQPDSSLKAMRVYDDE